MVLPLYSAGLGGNNLRDQDDYDVHIQIFVSHETVDIGNRHPFRLVENERVHLSRGL